MDLIISLVVFFGVIFWQERHDAKYHKGKLFWQKKFFPTRKTWPRLSAGKIR
jgi:hypothetical protein